MPDESERPSNAAIVSSWLADGTAAAEPVTVETPVTPPVVAAEPARDEAGKFVAAPAAETPAPTPQAVLDVIEARMGETAIPIPRGATIPLKRGETVEQVTIEELQKRGMLELDYRHKTAELGTQRRDFEAKQSAFAAEQARVTARTQWLQEQEAQMREAQRDPAAWEAYQEMQRLYQTNPLFKSRMDDALAKRETEAELQVYQERDRADQVRAIAATADTWVNQIGTEFPNVPPVRVRELYAQALRAGQATLDPAEVRALYQQEASYLTTSAGPLQQQLATLTARLAAIEAAKAAEQHNATTTHALDRAKSPPVTTTGSAPAPARAEPVKPFGPRELPDRNREWAARR